MATLAEMAVAREERDRDMVLLIHQGKTAGQIGKVLGLTARTVRYRAEKAGLECETVRQVSSSPIRLHRASRPCRHKPSECKSMPCFGHRFGADLVCQCGTDWHKHQREGLPCEIGLSPECFERDDAERCRNGHDISQPDSVYVYSSGKKECRICRSDRGLRFKQRKKDEQQRQQEERTECSRGHPWINVYVNPKGESKCRVCRKNDQDRWDIKRKSDRERGKG